MEFVSPGRKRFRDHLIQGILKQGLVKTSRVHKFPEITCEVYLCEHFSGEGVTSDS